MCLSLLGAVTRREGIKNINLLLPSRICRDIVDITLRRLGHSSNKDSVNDKISEVV